MKHFKSSDFYENPGGSYKLPLKNDAIPSICKFSIHSILIAFIPTQLLFNKPPITHKKKQFVTTSYFISNETIW